jgi:transglutaminase/protease-like cytokinesis protein 3
MTDYQKVAALHDWVVSNVKYDTSLQDISDYTALVDGKTVCRGYSMLLYKLLTKAGFNSHIVLGEVVSGFRYHHSAEGHAWNMV